MADRYSCRCGRTAIAEDAPTDWLPCCTKDEKPTYKELEAWRANLEAVIVRQIEEIAMLKTALRSLADYPYPAANGSFSQQEIARAALHGGQDPDSITRIVPTAIDWKAEAGRLAVALWDTTSTDHSDGEACS